VKRFSEGREGVTDEERSGRPATSRSEENIAKIRQILRENRRLAVRSIAEQVNIDRETVRKILTEGLDLRKVCVCVCVRACKSGPKRSSPKNKSKEESQLTKTLERKYDILVRVITGDETWVYQ